MKEYYEKVQNHYDLQEAQSALFNKKNPVCRGLYAQFFIKPKLLVRTYISCDARYLPECIDGIVNISFLLNSQAQRRKVMILSGFKVLIRSPLSHLLLPWPAKLASTGDERRDLKIGKSGLR